MKMDQITHSRDDVRPTLGFGSNKYTRYLVQPQVSTRSANSVNSTLVHVDHALLAIFSNCPS